MKTVLRLKGIGVILAGFLVIMISVNAASIKQNVSKDQIYCNNIMNSLVNVNEVISINSINECFSVNLHKKGINTIMPSNLETVAQTIAETFNREYNKANTDFKIRKFRINEVKNSHIILFQCINGILVAGASVSLHIHPNGYIYRINGKLFDNNPPSTIPTIDSVVALDIATRLVSNTSVNKGLKLLIWGGRLVYRVAVDEAGMQGMWNIIIDANTGIVLEKNNNISFYQPPGYPDSGQSMMQKGQRLEREQVSTGQVDSFIGWYATDNKYYLFNNDEHWLVIDDDTDTGKIASNNQSDWSTSNRDLLSLSFNLSKIQNITDDSLDQNSYDNEGAILISRYADSYLPGWAGEPINTMYIGRSTCDPSIDPLSITDVVAHEYGHALNYNNALWTGGQALRGEPKAIDEAYADIFGVCVVSGQLKPASNGHFLEPKTSHL